MNTKRCSSLARSQFWGITKGGGRRFGMANKTTGGLGSSSGVQGSSWRIIKVVNANFTLFGSISHISPIYAHVFRACRHHSTKSAKWGHLIPFAPLSASGRQLSPLPPPGFAAYDNYSHSLRRPHPGFYPGTFWGGGTSPQTSQLPPKNFWPALIS